jgi:hypothetical protein
MKAVVILNCDEINRKTKRNQREKKLFEDIGDQLSFSLFVR